jgi:O-antigen ligase
VTTSTDLAPLLRADRPDVGRPTPARAPVAAGRSRLAFVLVQAWLFLSFSCIDEHFPAFGKMHPRLVLGIAALAATFLTGWFRREPAPAGTYRPRTTFWVLATLVASLFSVLWAYEPSLAITAVEDHLTSVMVFFLVVGVARDLGDVRRLLLTFAAGSAVYLALSVWEWHGGRYDFTMGVKRMLGAGTRFADPNSFGATLAFALPVVVWLGIHVRRLPVRAAALVFCALSVYCVFKTSSRSALILLSLGSLSCLLLLPSVRLRVAVVGLLALGAVLMVATLSPHQKSRLASIVSANTYEHEESTRGRIEGYVVAWHILEQRPLLGVGPGNWSVYRARRVDGNRLLPHSLTGILLGTRGLAGTLAFLGFLFSSLRLGWRLLRRRAPPLEPAWRRLAWALLTVFGLLLVSGLGAHNIDRPNWFLAAAFLLVLWRIHTPRAEAVS